MPFGAPSCDHGYEKSSCIAERERAVHGAELNAPRSAASNLSPLSLLLRGKGRRRREPMRVFWFAGLLFLARWAHGSEYWNATELEAAYYGAGGGSPPLLVGLTLIQSAAAKGAGNTHLLSAFLLLFLALSDLCTLFGFLWLSSHLRAGNPCDAICVLLAMQRIATDVGDWFFDRGQVDAVDCAYPCDNTCHHIVFRGTH
ncbi:hypothetical protein B296_00025586 [Ensete ventricosum]|uniref:Pectin acetylesterase n=1 Tax=Ensete ventricosum TaxID=4639 RepID=A0A426ZUW0_ENSVE|nr:hypothetical protein B296_00025586 [Ensete ventricosum]